MEEGGRWVFPFVMSSEPSLAHTEHVGLSQTVEPQALHAEEEGTNQSERADLSCPRLAENVCFLLLTTQLTVSCVKTSCLCVYVVTSNQHSAENGRACALSSLTNGAERTWIG